MGAAAAPSSALPGLSQYHAQLLSERTEGDRTSIGGVAFRLRFRPRLGVVRAGGARSSPRWEIVPMVNNVFGRAAQPPRRVAELQKLHHATPPARTGDAPRERERGADTPCCKYLGRFDSLQASIAAARTRT